MCDLHYIDQTFWVLGWMSRALFKLSVYPHAEERDLSEIKTIPQSLRASSLYTREPLVQL